MNPNTKKSDTTSDAPETVAARAPNFDTLRSVKSLKNADFEDKQAVTLVETIRDAQSELATRADLEKSELALRSDMEKMEFALRRDMEKMETGIRSDMEKMETGIRSDMEKMGLALRAEIQQLRSEMEARFNRLSWYILAATSGATGAITGILSLVILFANAK